MNSPNNNQNYLGVNNYHAPPWPFARSATDQRLQQSWCPRCNKLLQQQVENYEPLYFKRTSTDQNLQSQWCPHCRR